MKPLTTNIAPIAIDKLDAFTRYYIAAALHLCDEEIGSDATIESIHPESLSMMTAECLRFQEENAATLKAAYAFATQDSEQAAGRQWAAQGTTDWFDGQAGTDFWLNRNGHGSGFWDRAELYGEQQAAALDKAAEAWHESDLYKGDDGRIYYSSATCC